MAKRLSQEELGEIIGKGRSVIGSYEKGHAEPSFDNLVNIAEYFGISIDKILNGNLESNGNLYGNPNGNPSASIEPKTSYQTSDPQPVVVTVDQQNRDNITMVDSKAAAGYPANLQEPEFYQDLPTFSLPGPEFRNATFRAFEVEGDSMSNTLYHGDWLIARHIEHFDDIREGYVHIIVTYGSIYVKRVLNRIQERNALVLQSDNATYPPFQLDPSDVQEIWRAKCKLSFILSNANENVNNRMANLEARMIELENQLNNKR